MNSDLSNIRPPEFPRPSSSLSRSLKARLRCPQVSVPGNTTTKLPVAPKRIQSNETQKPGTAGDIEGVISVLMESSINDVPIPKGFGEVAFDFNDNLSGFDNNESSIYGNSNLPEYKPYSSIEGHEDLMMKRYPIVPGSQELSIIYQQSQIATDNEDKGEIEHQTVETSPRIFHGDMYKAYAYEGLEVIAQSLATSSTEFCYLEIDPYHPYKFKITGIPKKLRHTKYFTLTRRGIIRHGESELTTFQDFIREQECFNKVCKIKIFRQFRLWRSFFIWKFEISSSKRARIVSISLVYCILLVASLISPDVQISVIVFFRRKISDRNCSTLAILQYENCFYL